MFKNILVPYDGSKPADTAANYAYELAKSLNQIKKDSNNKNDDDTQRCQVILLQVLPNLPSTPVLLERPIRTSMGETISFAEYSERLYKEMKIYVEGALDKKKKELEEKGLHSDEDNNKKAIVIIKSVVMVGDSIASTILEYAQKEKVDLIIIGNVGLTGIISKLKVFLGSVSRAVSERALCPVMIVR